MEFPRYLTFDCYGTLVDFALDPMTVALLGPRAETIDVDAFLRVFERNRFAAIFGPYRPYRDVLRESLAATMRQFRLPYQDADGAAIVAAVPTFGPFPDVPATLERIRRHAKIAIISTTDDDLIADNIRRIGVPIDRVITAAQARAYKPARAIFDYASRLLDCDAGAILHVAQGFEYDIVPAHALGWRRVWINRNGLPGNTSYGPYDELPDLSGLPALLGI